MHLPFSEKGAGGHPARCRGARSTTTGQCVTTMKSPHDWFNEIKQSEKEPIRLSDIDNLLEESIFNSSNGAKIAEYLKKRRGAGGRVRLHNIFEQVAATMPKPTFNFDLDTSEPQPLSSSPQTAEPAVSSVPEPIATTSSAPVQNGNAVVETVPPKPEPPIEPPPVVVEAHATRPASPKPVHRNTPGPSVDLGRQALLNQYHRTNMAKCELLKQITSSTPKPDENGTLSRISAFTTSISPIIETDSSPAVEPVQVVAPKPVEVILPEPVLAVQIPAPSVLPIESASPAQILAPCSQAPAQSTPQKVVIIGTPIQPGPPPSPDVVIPETPSPAKIPSESPKVTHHIQPRKLTDTFDQVQNDMADGVYENLTSDESNPLEGDQAAIPSVSQNNGETSIMRKSILKDIDSYAPNKRASLRVSFSHQLVQEREISPAPSIPEAHYSSSSSDDDDSSNSSDDDYQVVDEVYSDDGAECDPKDIQENYREYVGSADDLDKQMLKIHERPPSPLINVVDEVPVRWYETRSPLLQGNNPDGNALTVPATCTKENKTNLQLVDIITDWDEEDDDEEDSKQGDEQESPEKESQPSQPPPIEIPETQPSTQHTICESIDITDVEDSAERLVELPSPPRSLNGTGQENRVASPERPLTPPSQFTDSAKRRFLRENDEALISRLQNELPDSQQTPPQDTPTPERASETLVEVIQSFREQPPPKPIPAESRKTIVPVKKGRRLQSVDPATTTYFETVEKTFVKPAVPAKKSTALNQLSTAQKRKLYATTKHPTTPEQPPSVESVESCTMAVKNFNIVVRKLEVDKFLQKLTDADRAILEGPTKVGKSKRKPDLKSSKKLPEINRIDAERIVREQPTELRYPSPPEFAGFAEEENLQQRPEPLEQVLRKGSKPADSNVGAQSDEPAAEEPPNNEAVESKPSRPHRTRRAPKGKELGIVGTTSKGKSLKQKKDVTEEIAKPAGEGTGSEEIRLTSSEEDVQQTRIPEVEDPQSEKEHREEEQVISRTRLPADNVDHAQSNTQNPSTPQKRRGRPRKNCVDQVEADLPAPITITTEPVSSECSGDTASRNLDKVSETHNPEVDGRPESVSSTSSKGEVASNVGTAPQPLSSTDTCESVPSLSSGKEEAPSKAKQKSCAENLPTVESGEAVSSTSSGTEALSNVGNAPETNEVEPGEALESVPSVSSSSSGGSAASGSEKSGDNLPLKKRTLRQSSEDEPPALEPFGGDGAVETSDIEPPLLVPHDSTPVNTKRSHKRKAETHREKHTTEDSEKMRFEKPNRAYRDGKEEVDETWVPSKAHKNRYNKHVQQKKKKKKTGGTRTRPRDVEPEPESEPLRRGTRKRRLAKHTLTLFPFVKTINDQPFYREMSLEELIEQQKEEYEKSNAKAADGTKTISSNATSRKGNRKRAQEESDEPVTSKRNKKNRTDDEGSQASEIQSTAFAASSMPGDTIANAETVPMDRLMQEKVNAYGWVHKLMHDNSENGKPPPAGNIALHTLQHLNFKELNGIQYSFYLRSSDVDENYGFLRFAPKAVKKLTKTSNFSLRFLVLAGNIVFQLNDDKIVAKSGDFLALPEHSKYAIENGEDVSLLFMIKNPPSSMATASTTVLS